VTGPMSTARRTLARATYVLIVTLGAALTLVAVVHTVHFLPTAPTEFWALAAAALLVELSPLTIPHGLKPPTQLVVSLCLTFAILLLWGPGPATVVQTVALSLAAVRDPGRLNVIAFAVARYACAFQAAGWAESQFQQPAALGLTTAEFGIARLAAAAVTWLAVNYGLIAVMFSVSGSGIRQRWLGTPITYDLVATVGLLIASPALITAPTGWAVLILVVPLVAIGQMARLLGSQERTLNRDPLTQLPNLRGLAIAVDRLLYADAAAPDTPQRVGFLLVRVNGLGDIASVFGRDATDRLVIRIGERLTAEVGRDGAVIGRVAAADFVVLLPRADTAGTESIGAAVGASLIRPFESDRVVFTVRPAIGVAVAPTDGAELSALVAHAETALMDGRESVVPVRTSQEGDELQGQRRLSLLVDLRAAIDRRAGAGEIFVVYQPQVRVEDNRLVGVEALVRWRHPERGLVDTEDMILTAEASGVMQLLTLRVIDDVLQQLCEWSVEGLRLRASVNVSAKDLATERFAQQVEQCLLQRAMPPEQLELEVTESALEVANSQVDHNVAALVAMGVDLSLDDFGTGFASLAQLRLYPLRELKIDRSYIAAIAQSPTDRAVVASITQMATALGLRVVAEGVEDATTAQLLDQIGPIIGQGWHFGRPMPGPELVDWLRARQPHP
jgi:diguanylate cyclase (GGDEF)-like protein